MSFLLRRNLPWAWAGWYDSFVRPPEDPIKAPWAHWGSSSVGNGRINASEEMEVDGAFGLSEFFGGVSYEFQPFTGAWGFDYEVWWPTTSGFAANTLYTFIMQDWSRAQYSAYSNFTSVGLWHRPAIDGDTVKISQYSSLSGTGDVRGEGPSPIGWNGSTITVKCWIEADSYVRVWVNNVLCAQGMLTGAWRTGPGRRGINFCNYASNVAYYRWVWIYDRPSSVPSINVWSSSFYDDFNRANGAPGNGWTQIGTNAAIASNSWSTTGTTDGSRGLIRDTGITSGRVRVEATVGGNSGINNTADSGLVLCSTAAGDQGLCANIFGNQVFISRFSTALSGNPPTFTDLMALTTGVTVATGDVMAFSVYNGFAWLERNGTPIVYATGVHSVVPATNSYAGLRVERSSSNNSNSWNDVRIYSGI